MPPLELRLENGTHVIDVADIVKQILVNIVHSGKKICAKLK